MKREPLHRNDLFLSFYTNVSDKSGTDARYEKNLSENCDGNKKWVLSSS